MTFGQVLKKKDKRIRIGESGFRKVVKKMVPINKNNNAHVMATSHRNGHGNVILGIDSSFNANEIKYDFCFNPDSEHKLWKNNMLAWIKTLCSVNFMIHENKLTIVMMMNNMKNSVIAPIAIASNTLDFFLQNAL